MFCSNCGTQLPDNARFCSKCGNQVAVTQTRESQPKTPEQETDDFFNQLTDKQKEGFFEEAAKSLVERAKNGKVTLDTLNSGIKYLKLVKDLPSVDNNRFYLSLLVYQDAENAFAVHHVRWFKALNAEETDTIIGDFGQFLNGGLKELLLHTSLVDNVAQERILAHAGIARFLEQALLTHVLVCIKMANGEIKPEGKAMLIQHHGEELVRDAFDGAENSYNSYLEEARKKL